MDIKQLPPFLQRYVIKRIIQKNDGKTYQIVISPNGQRPGIHCLICNKTSWSRGDVNHRFCILCGFHKDIAQELFVPKVNPYAG